MARIPAKFNESNETMDDRSLIKPGRYLMEIVDSDYKENSAKNGHYIYLKRKILEAAEQENQDQVGRFLFRNLNVDHPNTTTAEIANKEWTSTRIACGVLAPEETEELHGIPHWVEVYTKPSKNKDKPATTEIAKIEKAEGVAPAVKPAANPGAATPSAPSAPRRPLFMDDDDE